jgi:hypothetical protein
VLPSWPWLKQARAPRTARFSAFRHRPHLRIRAEPVTGHPSLPLGAQVWFDPGLGLRTWDSISRSRSPVTGHPSLPLGAQVWFDPGPRTSDLGLHISSPLSCYWSPVTTFGRTSLVRPWTSDLILYLVPALSVFLSALTLPPMGFLSVANSCHPLFSSTSPGSPSYRYGRQPDRLRRLTKCPHSGDFVFQGRPKASLRAIRKVQG